MMAACRVEDSEVCYGNLDITSGTLERTADRGISGPSA